MKGIFLGNATCAIVEHVDFEPIGWTKFVPFHVASASQINKKKWVKVFLGMMKVHLGEH